MSATVQLLSLGAIATGLGGIAGLFYVSITPRSRFWGPVVYQGSRADPPRVALTFDDGPHPAATGQVLDALGEAGVKAAFFVIGRNAARWPDVVRRVDAEGHLVGNHSYDHSHYGIMGRTRYWRRQVRETDDLLAQILGKKPLTFRPPMGIRTGHTMHAAREGGHTLVTWTRRSLDGSSSTTPGRILGRVLPHARAGSILVLHDGVEPNSRRDPSPTVAAVRPLVRGLRERGVEPVRLDELIGVRAYAGTGEGGGETPGPVSPPAWRVGGGS